MCESQVAAPLTPTVGDYTTAVAAAGVGVTALTLASGADAIIAHKRRKQRSITPES